MNSLCRHPAVCLFHHHLITRFHRCPRQTPGHNRVAVPPRLLLLRQQTVKASSRTRLVDPGGQGNQLRARLSAEHSPKGVAPVFDVESGVVRWVQHADSTYLLHLQGHALQNSESTLCSHRAIRSTPPWLRGDLQARGLAVRRTTCTSAVPQLYHLFPELSPFVAADRQRHPEGQDRVCEILDNPQRLFCM